MNQKDGRYQWVFLMKMQEGWKECSVSVDTAEILMDLFKDRQTQFGLDPIMMVPTSGAGTIAAVPRSVAGVDYWSADLKDCKKYLD